MLPIAHTVRRLARRPRYAAGVVASLAVGLAAATTMAATTMVAGKEWRNLGIMSVREIKRTGSIRA